MKFIYAVVYWAYPRSGFDVIKKNMVMSIFKEMVKDIQPDSAIKTEIFAAEHEGFVTYDIVIESDKRITDAEFEIMPLIRKEYPEAKLLLAIPMSGCEKEFHGQ